MKSLISFLFSFVLTQSLMSQTTLSGDVYDGNKGPLTLAGSPYTINGITIPAGRILTIEPGVILNISVNKDIIVRGTLNAIGLENNKITFSSTKEDVYWRAIRFDNSSIGRFKCCKIERGGGSNGSMKTQIAIEKDADVEIDNCELSNSKATCIYSRQSEGDNTKISITNSTFLDNLGSPIFITKYSSGTCIINDNTFERNGGPAINISPNIYPLNNVFKNNRFNGIELYYNKLNVQNAIVSGSYDCDILCSDYQIMQNIEITIQPGVNVFIRKDCGWSVYGKLIAIGNKNKRITFQRANPQPWSMINLRSGSSAIFKNCDIMDGGNQSSSIKTMLYVDEAISFEMEDCILSGSKNDGLQAKIGYNENSYFKLINNIFLKNMKDGISLDIGWRALTEIKCNLFAMNYSDGFRFWGSKKNLTIDNNYFTKNVNSGLKNESDSNIVAKNNWWGDISGPSGIGNGTGDAILNLNKGSVIFEPWAVIPSFGDCNGGSYQNSPAIIEFVSKDTLTNGEKEILIIRGKNFFPDAKVYLSRGNRIPNPGDVVGKILSVSYGLIIVEFSLFDEKIIEEWDLVVENPNQGKALYKLYVQTFSSIPDIEWAGNIGFFIREKGHYAYNSNYLLINSLGDSKGSALVTILPPKPGLINLTVGDSDKPIWNSFDEVDKSVINLIVPTGFVETKIPLWWFLSAKDVTFPQLSKKEEYDDILDGDGLVAGSSQRITLKGLGGAAKSQLFDMAWKTLLNTACDYIGDRIQHYYDTTKDKASFRQSFEEAIERQLEDAQDPKEMFMGIAGEVFLPYQLVDIGTSIGKCLAEIIGDFLNSWKDYINKRAEQYKENPQLMQQDISRAIRSSSGRFTVKKAQEKYWLDYKPSDRTPYGLIKNAFDPNNKITTGEYVSAFEPAGDSVRLVH